MTTPSRVTALAGLALTLTGCVGGAQNPSYFPYLWAGGRIERTHAKPRGSGYFADFDPHARRIEVRPNGGTLPVRASQVLIATIYDETGKPRRGRRVEWLLEGAGQILEVDESGSAPSRGYKVDNRYAVSYTDYFERTIDRGNDDPADDFCIRPGQSWCVVTSATEGDTAVTVYAPEIHDWDHNKVVVTLHWVDAGWMLPVPASCPPGTSVPMTVKLYRLSDRQPLAGYRVRFRVADGPPAVVYAAKGGGTGPAPGEDAAGSEAMAVSDLGGLATVLVSQPAPQGGTTKLSIEVIRPPDPTASSGVGVVVGRGETGVTWQAASVSLDVVGPDAAPVGQPISYTITVGNTGPVATGGLTVRQPIPDGLNFDKSDPPAVVENGVVIWTLPALAQNERKVLTATYQAARSGSLTSRVRVDGGNGISVERQAKTEVTTARLAVVQAAPTVGVTGAPVAYEITVSNPGSAAAANVVLRCQFDPGLTHQSNPPKNEVELAVGRLAPGQSQAVPLSLTPTRAGVFKTRVTATADGNLAATSEHAIDIKEPLIDVAYAGPTTGYIGREANWEFTVVNRGGVALQNVTVKDRLPAEFTFRTATENGRFAGGEVVWALGTLSPGDKRTVRVTGMCERSAARAVHLVTAIGEPRARKEIEVPFEILGVPGLRMELATRDGLLEIGGRTVYTVTVSNDGTLPADGVEVSATLPPQLRPLSGTGPEGPRIVGQRVTFPAFKSLSPNQWVRYTIDAEAVAEGDARFTAEVKSAASPTPVRKEAATRVVPAGGS